MLNRHSHTHNHDPIKVFTLVVQVMGNFITILVALASTSRNSLALARIIVFAVITLLILLVNVADTWVDLCTNKRPISQNKEQWLVTTSKVFTILGVTSYYVGDNIPGILDEFSSELDCSDICVERGYIAGVFLLFIALTTFTFLPQLFQKINTIINENYEVHHYVRKEPLKEHQLQYFVLRMLALVLEFDTVYSAVWEFAFLDIENCDTDDIIGSSLIIIAGWVTWLAYAFIYTYYLPTVQSLLKEAVSCKQTKHRVINGLYHATLLLFVVTMFPVHILGDNEEPISCGCTGSSNTSRAAFTCDTRPGVLETRLVFFSYQLALFVAMASLGAVKRSLEKTRDN